MTDFEQRAIDHLVGKGLIDRDWDNVSSSVIDLSDAEDFSIVTVVWEDSSGDDHTAVVRVVNQDGGFLRTHVSLYGLNVA